VFDAVGWVTGYASSPILSASASLDFKALILLFKNYYYYSLIAERSGSEQLEENIREQRTFTWKLATKLMCVCVCASFICHWCL